MNVIFGISIAILSISFAILVSSVIYNNKTVIITLSIITLIITFMNVIISANQLSKPTNKDIINKTAIYQENLHIIDNDIIKTYEIVWKRN